MKKIILYVILLLRLLFASCLTSAQTTETLQEATVNTTSGKVRGQWLKGIVVFKSIPYAAPPVGIHRFAAPVKPVPWQGIRDAIQSGPTAPFTLPKEADMDATPVFGKGWIKGDDYLTTNVWTPRPGNGRLPVMVYIHGGAFVLGASDVPLFNGASFARQGVVLVSFNYRLGMEGFLKIKGVPSNIGIRDQIAALQWVRDNIAAFGGDPGNVTIFGESAGAMSVSVLLVSPAARGLFKRAIMLSGSGQAVLSGEQAGRIANQYAKVLNIANTREAYLRFTPEQLLAAQAKVTPKMVHLETEEHANPTGGLVLFFPVIDGDVVPDIPLKKLQQGAGGAYDLMLGYNTDEVNYFLVPAGLLKKIKFNFILNKAVQTVYPAPSAIITIYKNVYPKKNLGEIFSAILTAYQFQLPSVRFAQAHSRHKGKTFMYEFAWKSSVANGAYGAYHGLALPFVFNNMESVRGERGMLGPKGAPDGLAEKMHAAFVQFAKTGSPGWDAYHAGDHKTMRIGETWQLQVNPHAKEIAIWEGIR